MNFIRLMKYFFSLAHKYIVHFLTLFASLFLLANYTVAATYVITNAQYPTCTSGTWSVSGTTYTCSGRVTLASGDILSASSAIKIIGSNGFTLNNNTIGSSSANINLASSYGTITSTNTNTIYGYVTSDSGNVNLTNTSISNYLTTNSATVTLTGSSVTNAITASADVTLSTTTVGGAITTSANVNLTGGSVAGLVTSTSNTITTNGTNLSGGAKANSGMTINGGTIAGAFTMSANNALALNGVTMTSGSISGASTVSISGGSVGLSSASISVTSVSGAISVQNATVYGALTAPSYSTVNVTSSSIYGTCSPSSTPANACSATPAVCTTGLVGGLAGSYFNNKTLTGPATGFRTDNTVNFDWGTGAPGVTGIGVDNFSIQWNGTLRAPTTGNYTFQTLSDDGVRLYINNQLVINNWTDHGVTTNNSSAIALTAGQAYPVRLEYYENGGSAVMKLNWLLPGSSSYIAIGTQTGVTPSTASYCAVPTTSCTAGLMGGAAGKYYNNTTLTSPIAATRIDTNIDFNWDSGAPGVSGVGADNFSVRWDGNLNVSTSGSYQFETVSDDGVRVWINNQLVIDDWNSHSATTNTTAAITLNTGINYPVRVEYFEGGGLAVMQFHWKTPGNTSYVSVPGCPSTLSYYAISHSGTGITCAASPITFSALDSAGTSVAPTAGTQVTLSTTPSTGVWVGGNTYTFGGTETSFTKYLQQLTGSTLNVNITDGTYSESAAYDPNITFTDTALMFYSNSSASSGLVNQVAGTTNSSPILKAIRTDTATGACVARTTGTQSVKLAYVCRNPSTCIGGQTLTVNGVSIQSNPNANLASPTYTSVNLTFDSNGSASIPLMYSDVGQIQLAAQLPLLASGNDPAVTITGASNDFVVKPYSIVVTSVQDAAGRANPGATSAAGTSYDFVSAGTAFKVALEVRNSQGARTPNFGNETQSENNIRLGNLVLAYPSTGDATPLTSANSFSIASPAGTFTSTAVAWQQVGSFTVQPQLADDDYLGAGNITPTTSGVIGRIYPDHFTLVSSTTANACGAFTYMGQPMQLSYIMHARSLNESILTNYGSGYGDPVGIVVERAFPSYTTENNNGGDAVALAPRLSITSSTDWAKGVYVIDKVPLLFNRQTSGAPDGPYASLQLGIDITDNFDSRLLAGKNMNSLTSTNCLSLNNCTSVMLGAALNLRYGRLRMDDAYGPESVSLPANLVSEYWIGNRFVQNTLDSCTQVPRAMITYPKGTLTNDANRTVNIGSGSTGNYNSIDSSGVNFSGGTAGPYYFTAPGASGNFVVGINLSTLTWLIYDWNQNNNYSDDINITANYRFGSYRGNDRIIYWRERLQ